MATATVTILFTDLVGSTALMSRVGEAEADALRREHFEILRRSIGSAGGVEVKNLGDGLMVAFTSAADAVAAAVGMQEGLFQRNRRADEALEIRIGLAIGDVEVEDDDYFGAPVVQAARLCAAAGAGEVLGTDLVRLMAGTRTDAEFEPIGALELKGLEEPVAAVRVCWSPPEDEAARGGALPGRLAQSVAADFVGRDDEFRRILDAAGAVRAGERRVVLLAGEPGIGKTTLAARAAVALDESGLAVAYGRSDEDLGVPYQPWAEALAHLVDALPQHVLDEHVAERGAHLARLVPGLARRSPGGSATVSAGDAEGERFVLFGCVVDLLERATAERPLLLVLDDLHWADRQSLQLLRHVVGCGRPLRLLVLGTFRDSDVVAGDPLSEVLAALHREQGIERIAVRGLRDVDLQDLLEHLAGHDLDDHGLALRDAVLAETSGNPFFVREILRHLVESGAIYRDERGRWVGDLDVRTLGLPVSITEVIGRRLATLGDETVRLLSVAAVIGRDFDVALLASAAGVGEDEAIDRCDAAVGASILAPTEHLDRYSFTHALIERTLYENLSPPRRARAHSAVAESIELIAGDDPGDRAAELARHWADAGQLGDDARVLRYVQLAGDRALSHLAPDDAVGWYTRAVDLLAGGGEERHRAQLLVGLGEAQRQVGDARFRPTLAEAAELAERAGDVDLLVAAALGSCRNFPADTGAVDAELVGLLERALARVGSEDTARRARLLVAVAAESCYGDDLERVAELSRQAIEVARRVGDPATLAFVLQRSCIVDREPSQLALRREWLDEALELNAEVGDPVLEFDIADQRRLVALEGADADGLARFQARVEAAALRAPHATAHWMLAFHRVWRLILDGDLVAAERQAEAAFELGLESGQRDAATIYGAQLTNIRYHGGRLEEIRELFEALVRDRPGLASYRSVLTLTDALTGRLAEAAAALDDAQALGFPARRDGSFTTALTAWAGAAVITGHPSLAQLGQHLLPVSDVLVTTQVGVQPAVAYVLGRVHHALGRFEEAERWYARADDIHRRLESPLLVAYSDAGRAELLADRAGPGDREEARRLADGALAASRAGGFRYIEADARSVLEQLA